MDWFAGPNWVPVAWLTVAAVLFIGEVLGMSGFFIGAAVAAVAMALLTFLVSDIGFATQFVVFAVVSVVATLVYFRFFRATQPSNSDSLPQRSQMMLGKRFTLEESLPAGSETRVQLGDTMWRVIGESQLDAGTEVVVVGGDQMRLEIAAAEVHATS